MRCKPPNEKGLIAVQSRRERLAAQHILREQTRQILLTQQQRQQQHWGGGGARAAGSGGGGRFGDWSLAQVAEQQRAQRRQLARQRQQPVLILAVLRAIAAVQQVGVQSRARIPTCTHAHH